MASAGVSFRYVVFFGTLWCVYEFTPCLSYNFYICTDGWGGGGGADANLTAAVLGGGRAGPGFDGEFCLKFLAKSVYTVKQCYEIW